MSNELFIACGAVSSVAVVASLWACITLERDRFAYLTVWLVSVAALLLVVAAYTWATFANYWEGPQTGSMNPGGPSGPTIEGLLVLVTGLLVAPASYVCSLILFLLPPTMFGTMTKRRIRVYGISLVVITSIVSFYFLHASSVATRQQREESLKRRLQKFSTSSVLQSKGANAAT